MSNDLLKNRSQNFNYLIACVDGSFTQARYIPGRTFPELTISQSTLKNSLHARSFSNKTAAAVASSFSLLLLHPDQQRITEDNLGLPPEEFKRLFPVTSFSQLSDTKSYLNLSLFTNKLYRCYYMVPNSLSSAYMGYFKLFGTAGRYHAYMVRGIQDFSLAQEILACFETPHLLAETIQKINGNKKTESMHLYEAWSNEATDSKSGEHKDISFTKNCITINFHSIEEDPCFCTMFWNVHAAVKLKLSSYIGGSALIVDTNDGNRNKNISAFKMGLEAVEDIPISQHAITQKGPLVPDSLRLIKELSPEPENGLMVLNNNDDDRWFRFLQIEDYRNSVSYQNVDVDKLVSSLRALKTSYEMELDNLINYIEGLKK